MDAEAVEPLRLELAGKVASAPIRRALALDDAIQKPVTPESLARKIREVLEAPPLG